MFCFNFNVKAQTSLTEAVDFYSVDEWGTEVRLFDILDHGQYALLYFFFSDAESSPQFDPCIAEAYLHFGANQDNVYFIGVAPSDDSLAIDGWKYDYQVDFPVVTPFANYDNAHDICTAYGVNIFSTLVLIAPNREIIINNIWPIVSGEKLITKIQAAIVGAEDVVELRDESFNVYPNPATTEVKITSEMSGESEVNIFDMTGRRVKNIRVSDVSNATINVSDLNQGIYFINVNGRIEKLTINS